MHTTAVPEIFLPVEHENGVVKALHIALNEVQAPVGKYITSETGLAAYRQLCNELSALIQGIVYPFPEGEASTPASEILAPRFTAIKIQLEIKQETPSPDSTPKSPRPESTEEKEYKLISEFKNFCEQMAYQKFSELERARTAVPNADMVAYKTDVYNVIEKAMDEKSLSDKTAIRTRTLLRTRIREQKANCEQKETRKEPNIIESELKLHLDLIRREQTELQKKLDEAARKLKSASHPWRRPRTTVDDLVPGWVAPVVPNFIGSMPVWGAGVLPLLPTEVEIAVDKYLVVPWKTPANDYTIKDIQKAHQEMDAERQRMATQYGEWNQRLNMELDVAGQHGSDDEEEKPLQNSIFSVNEKLAVGVSSAVGIGTTITGSLGYAGVGLLATVWHPVGWAVLILVGVVISLAVLCALGKKIYDHYKHPQQQTEDIDLSRPNHVAQPNEHTTLIDHSHRPTASLSTTPSKPKVGELDVSDEALARMKTRSGGAQLSDIGFVVQPTTVQTTSELKGERAEYFHGVLYTKVLDLSDLDEPTTKMTGSTKNIKTLLNWNPGLKKIVNTLNTDKGSAAQHVLPLYFRQDPGGKIKEAPDVIIGSLGISYSGGLFNNTASTVGFWNWNCNFYKVEKKKPEAQTGFTPITPQNQHELIKIADPKYSSTI